MGLFKRAAARGAAHELIRRGVIAFSSKEAADEAADAVADAMPSEGPSAMPEVSPDQGHNPEDMAMIANKLIEIAHALMSQEAGPPPGGGEMPPGGGEIPAGLPPEVAKAASDLQKTAAAADLETLASEVAVACMDKAAEEVKHATGTGTLVVGTTHNKGTDAAKNDSVAAMDQKNRPDGAYHKGVGNTEFPNPGDSVVGHLGKPTVMPSQHPEGTNSVNSDAKKAELREHVQKIAKMHLVGLATTKKDNTLASSAVHDNVAALDLKNRADKKYLVGQGHTNFSEPQAARVGLETKHPDQPSVTVSGTNSVIQASKTSSEDDAFVLLFKKCAEDVGPYLPTAMPEDEKIAAISHMIGFDHNGRQGYLETLHAKVAAAKPVETPATPAADGGKKESSLVSQMREIASKAGVQPAA